VNANQLRRWPARQGCSFEEGKRHTIVVRGDRYAALPRHGGGKQLGTGLMESIKKDLGL
jgi:mRNA interferase HicA